jgi:preprotein translocase subunit SecY
MITVLTLTTGAVFVMWLGERITEQGIGNGMSLLIFFSIMQGMWPGILKTVEFLKTGVIDLFKLLVLLAVMLAVVAGVVAITVAARRIPIQIPRKVMGRGRIREGQKTFIPIRINSSGVMPIIFAQSIIIVPGTLATFSNIPALRTFSDAFQPGSILYYVTYAALIVFFTYFYTSIIFNPVDLAENLKKQGGFVPGVKPGSATADYIDDVLTRVTLPGSLFLCVVALLPFFVLDAFNVPFFFGGTALLIVVGVGLDTIVQVQQHLHLRHYDDFMKKGRIKFRGRRRIM